MYKVKVKIIKIYILLVNASLSFTKKTLWLRKPIEKFKNICIYKIGNIGDIICAVPAMYKIRTQFPDAKITLLTTPGKKKSIGADAILQGVSWIDYIDTYYSDDIDSVSKIKKFVQRQKDKNYDYLIQLPAENTSLWTQIRNMIFVKAMKVKYADGFYISNIKLFKKVQSEKMKSPNEVERLIFGLPFKKDTSIQFPLYISPLDKEIVENLLKECRLTRSDKIMMISHTGKASANKWPTENFKEISTRWVNKGGKVLVIGGTGEAEEAQAIIKNLGKNAYNFCGKTTLIQSMYLLTKADFLLTIDTGTAHMASAMNVNCITLSSSATFRGKWVAYGEKNKVFRKDLECSPCVKKECRYEDNRCMKAITVEEVWDYIEKKFG